MKHLFLFFVLLSFSQSILSQTLKVENYYYLGDFHNSALDYVISNAKQDKFSSNVDNNVNYIKTLINDYYNLNSSKIGSSFLNYDDCKYFVVESNFFEYLYSDANSYKGLSGLADASISSFNSKIGINNSNNILGSLFSETSRLGISDTYEVSILKELQVLIKKNKEGLISANELLDKLNLYESEFNSKNYDISSNQGQILAITLAISIKSMEWWIKNASNPIIKDSGKNGPNSYDVDFVAIIAPWVASDIAGAIVGTAGGAIGSYYLTGSVSWGAVGFGALWTATMSSTGAVGRLARLIKR